MGTFEEDMLKLQMKMEYNLFFGEKSENINNVEIMKKDKIDPNIQDLNKLIEESKKLSGIVEVSVSKNTLDSIDPDSPIGTLLQMLRSGSSTSTLLFKTLPQKPTK